MAYRYPCGCIGLGRPPKPLVEKQEEAGPAASLVITWVDVLVIAPCDRDEHWEPGMIAPRLLQGRRGLTSVTSPCEAPVRLKDAHPIEAAFWAGLGEAFQKAGRWTKLQEAIQLLLKE